ncbi:ELO family [Trypanosoma melophagium]|uniref:ELO family n=1 Tax=Trypanosoma melophagium TaxID=715481 RepID=UPI00351A9D7D|nr:ELO family [Trypanosoma melophagium]
MSTDLFLSQSRAQAIAAVVELPDWLIASVARGTYYLVGPALDSFEFFAESQFPHLREWIQNLEGQRHPFASKLPLLNFWYVIFSLLCYFGGILLLLLTAKIMGKRKYRFLVVLHNLFLFSLSLYMSFAIMVTARAADFSLWNNPAGTSNADWRLAKLLWLFYISKIPEWMDTFVMCLKQNTRQITFLHLYHHSTIFFIWYVCCSMAPGGEAYWSAMVNSSVHVIMYGYYFLTAVFEEGKVRRFLNRFKFFITKGQMLQFAINCVQSIYDLYIVPQESLNYDVRLLQLLFWYMISLLMLFGNFLLRAPRSNVGGRGNTVRYSESIKKTPHNSDVIRKSEVVKPAYEIKNSPRFDNRKRSKKKSHENSINGLTPLVC